MTKTGRDDRIISDHGKEIRFPFLDENLFRTMNEIPLWHICDPSGVPGGDKRIFRNIAQKLGLLESGLFTKRAIQFGSRSSKMYFAQSGKTSKIDGSAKFEL